MSEPILEVTDLSIAYGQIHAVRGASFRAATGSLVTLVGANGAGKTSILNSVAGLVRPRAGRVLFSGADVTGRPAHRLVAAGLVLVPEGRRILGTMTVEENLRLGGWHQRRTAARSIAEAYDRFPVLADLRRLPASALSGGEQQMLAIARALVARPRVLLLDEPSTGLAPRIVEQVFAAIAGIRATGTTIVLVDQNARRALRAADYGYVVDGGRITHQDPGAGLLGDDRVLTAYLGPRRR